MQASTGNPTLVAAFTITTIQSTSSENTKTGKSFVSGPTFPGPISSRFLDLGGVISQLFPGFNQGAPGGSPGLNFPPNSQFYPDVLAQGFNPGQPTGFGNKWLNLNQGIIQGSNHIGGSQSQQPIQSHPSPLNFNSQTGPHKGQLYQQAQDLAQILNIQNNNGPEPRFRGSGLEDNARSQRSASINSVTPETPFTFGSNQYGALDNRFEGTLDDFFTTESPSNDNNDHKIIFPSHDDEVTMRTSTNNAIWGKQVTIPTTTVSNDRIVFLDDSETPFQKQCVQNCPTTSEYNPVCGSDSVTYFNPGRLVCARNCGINVRERRRGSCGSRSG
ncbi:hypothetical protein ABMA27_002081 [Loxostege sticticalis]|uniref:Kazal-like domain-containing protein n=1 Tax=Loxostege sticticalis TaxID=481309 RepID=A0ABR3HWN5_LOXSC